MSPTGYPLTSKFKHNLLTYQFSKTEETFDITLNKHINNV